MPANTFANHHFANHHFAPPGANLVDLKAHLKTLDHAKLLRGVRAAKHALTYRLDKHQGDDMLPLLLYEMHKVAAKPILPPPLLSVRQLHNDIVTDRDYDVGLRNVQSQRAHDVSATASIELNSSSGGSREVCKGVALGCCGVPWGAVRCRGVLWGAVGWTSCSCPPLLRPFDTHIRCPPPHPQLWSCGTTDGYMCACKKAGKRMHGGKGGGRAGGARMRRGGSRSAPRTSVGGGEVYTSQGLKSGRGGGVGTGSGSRALGQTSSGDAVGLGAEQRFRPMGGCPDAADLEDPKSLDAMLAARASSSKDVVITILGPTSGTRAIRSAPPSPRLRLASVLRPPCAHLAPTLRPPCAYCRSDYPG